MTEQQTKVTPAVQVKQEPYAYIWLADNLNFLEYMVNEKSKENTIDMIYIDPPFNSKRNYNIVFNHNNDATEKAFTDIWSNISYLDELEKINTINPNLHSFLKMLETTGLPKSYISYLTALGIRLYYMQKMLKPTGSIFLHCDATASHYIKIVMDYVFGMNNFRNEVIWRYGVGIKSNKHKEISNHDVIFSYAKDLTNSKFNPSVVDYTESQLARFKHEDTEGKYYHDTRRDANGDKVKVKVYLKKTGTPAGDDWYIPIVQGAEKLGYPTQKPEELIKRIISSATDAGDIVMDLYSGGGTTCSVAKKLGRNSVACDINYRSLQITKERLEALGMVVKTDLIIKGIPNNADDLRKMVKDNILGTYKNSRFDLEDVTVKYYMKHVVGNDVKVNDDSIDGTYGFKYNGENCKGIVQVTSGSNKNHLKAFCSEVAKGTADVGVYITFADCITDGFVQEVKGYGKFGDIDKIQLISFEELIDKNSGYKIPTGASFN